MSSFEERFIRVNQLKQQFEDDVMTNMSAMKGEDYTNFLAHLSVISTNLNVLGAFALQSGDKHLAIIEIIESNNDPIAMILAEFMHMKHPEMKDKKEIKKLMQDVSKDLALFCDLRKQMMEEVFNAKMKPLSK